MWNRLDPHVENPLLIYYYRKCIENVHKIIKIATIIMIIFPSASRCINTETYRRARLLSAAAAHIGSWLHTLPISTCVVCVSTTKQYGRQLDCGLALNHARLIDVHAMPLQTPAEHTSPANPTRLEGNIFIVDLNCSALMRVRVPSKSYMVDAGLTGDGPTS